MGALSRVINLFGGQRPHPLDRLEAVLHSLRARGLIEDFRELSSRQGYVLQWSRGNFGHQLMLDAKQREFIAIPVALQVGPYAGSEPVDHVLSMQDWRVIGQDVPLGRINGVTHVELIENIRRQGLEHPCLPWFAERFKDLADGKRPSSDDMAALVLLGARKFMKTIPNTDRLHERIAPAIVTLLNMASRERARAATGEIGEVSLAPDYAQAMLEFAQESHPQEARRAIRAHAMR